jgi:two-component system, NarL family, sensor histidine kinase UhpB
MVPYHGICPFILGLSQWAKLRQRRIVVIQGPQVESVKRGVNWAQLGKLVLMILAVQGVYWFLIDGPLFRADPGERPPTLELTNPEIARLTDPSFLAASKAKFKPVELPFTHCCETASFAVKMRFKVERIPEQGLGLLSMLQVDNYLLAVNGSQIVGQGRMGPRKASFHGQKTFLTRIPAGLLKPGENELTYVTVRDGFPYTDIYPPLIADYAALERHASPRLFILNDSKIISGIVLGLLGLLATIMVFRSDDWRFAAWLSALCSACVASLVYALWLDPPVDGWGRMLAYFAIFMFIPVALLCFIDSWSKKPIPRLQHLALALYGVIIGVVAFYIYRVPMPEGFDHPTMIYIYFLPVAAVLVLARLVWHFATESEDRMIESALMTVLAVALIIDSIYEWYPAAVPGNGNLQNASVFLLLAMMVAFLARNFRLFQSQGALASMLQAKVDQREAELVEAAKREQLLVRQQAHDEERRRIMRDLHDGLGSQLMSMMLSARVGIAEPAQVAEGLQSVIDEMRLMVDSMDSVGESLASALATFRARVQPRVQQAGIAFLWDQPAGDLDQPGYGPRDVLQVFRVLQEAVTNALKHAAATEIKVSIVEASTSLTLTVSDNGKGMVAGEGVGRGMSNMESRARSVGGIVTLGPNATGQGTSVTLTLPTTPLVQTAK